MSIKIKSGKGFMKAIEIVKFGGPENLKVCKRAIPEIENNQVLIKVEYSGINRPDILQREGNYPVPKNASDIPGLEVSGTIVDKGKSATKYKIGEKICALCHGGGYAEYVAVNQDHCLPVPKTSLWLKRPVCPKLF